MVAAFAKGHGCIICERTWLHYLRNLVAEELLRDRLHPVVVGDQEELVLALLEPDGVGAGPELVVFVLALQHGLPVVSQLAGSELEAYDTVALQLTRPQPIDQPRDLGRRLDQIPALQLICQLQHVSHGIVTCSISGILVITL